MTFSRLPGLVALVATSIYSFAAPVKAATNVLPARTGQSTNVLAKPPGTAGKTNAFSKPQAGRGITNAPGSKITQTNLPSGMRQTLTRWRSSPHFYQIVIGASICVVLLLLFLARGSKAKGLEKAGLSVSNSKLAPRPGR